MVEHILCPKCRQQLIYIRKFHDYYCEYCMVFPLVGQEPSHGYPYYRPSFQGTRSSNLGKVLALMFIVSPLLVLMFAYFFYIPPPPPPVQRTPTGALQFTESDDTVQTGSFVAMSKTMKLNDVSLIITDNSLGISASMDPLRNKGFIMVEGGVNCSFIDNNENLKIDGGDTIRVINADIGDIIRFIYRPTSGVIAVYTFE